MAASYECVMGYPAFGARRAGVRARCPYHVRRYPRPCTTAASHLSHVVSHPKSDWSPTLVSDSDLRLVAHDITLEGTSRIRCLMVEVREVCWWSRVTASQCLAADSISNPAGLCAGWPLQSGESGGRLIYTVTDHCALQASTCKSYV